MKKLFLALIFGASIIASTCEVKAQVNKERVKITCYTPESCPGSTTATGQKVREGIIACNPHLGDGALIYSVKGEFLGYYECLDTGGSKGLKDGTQIDMWMPSNDKAWELVRELNDGSYYSYVDVIWVESPKG